MEHLATLVGDWQLYRLIDDARTGKRLIFSGMAVFVPDGDGLRYQEAGSWIKGDWAGHKATQTHLWRASGAGVEVLYQDGRPFHHFDWPGDTGTVEAGHDCAPDRYDATYRFALPDRWEVDWRAKGPAKDYVSRTRFDRPAPDAATP